MKNIPFESSTWEKRGFIRKVRVKILNETIQANGGDLFDIENIIAKRRPEIPRSAIHNLVTDWLAAGLNVYEGTAEYGRQQ